MPRSIRRTGRTISTRSVLHETWQNSRLTSLVPSTDAMVTGDQSYTLAPKGYSRIRQDWQQIAPVNMTLLSADAMKAGDQFTELSPKGYQRIRLDWSWNNINIQGQDDMVIGEQTYNLSPRGYQYIRPDWTWNNINVQGTDAMVTGEQVFELPAKGYQRIKPDWQWNNPNVQGQDAMVTGEQIYDLAPRGYSRIRTDWTWNNPNVQGQDEMTEGVQLFELPPIGYRRLRLDWEWNNRNIQGQDEMAIGDQFFELSPRSYQRIRPDWIVLAPVNTLTPPSEEMADGIKGITWPNERLRSPYDKWLRLDWVYNNTSVQGQDAMVEGVQADDLPPRGYQRIRPDWLNIAPVNTVLLGELPDGNQFTEVPPWGYQRLRLDWAYNNVSVQGQDEMATGEQFFELAPKGYQRLRSDWQTIAPVNTLFLADLPVGDQLYDLVPRSYQWRRLDGIFIAPVNTILGVELPAGDQSYEPAPRGYSRIRTDWQTIAPVNTLLIAETLPDGTKGIAWPDQKPRSPYDKWSRLDWAYNNIVIQGTDAIVEGVQDYQDILPRRHWYMQDHILAAILRTLLVEPPAPEVVVVAQPAPRIGGRFPEFPVGVRYVVRIILILPEEWDVLARPKVTRKRTVRVYADAEMLVANAYRRSVVIGFAFADLSILSSIQIVPVFKEAYHRIFVKNELLICKVTSDGFANRGKRAERIRMHLFRLLDI